MKITFLAFQNKIFLKFHYERVNVLTSGKSQWSKDACKKFLAADLYFLVANSAKPAAHLNLVSTTWLASLPLF